MNSHEGDELTATVVPCSAPALVVVHPVHPVHPVWQFAVAV